MNRTPLKRNKGIDPISKKRQALLPKYRKLIEKLRRGCGNKSELSGDAPDWKSEGLVDPHHIRGRAGALWLDPFNIILLTRTEHDIEEGKIKGDKVGLDKLRQIVLPIRISQGYSKEEI